MFKAIMDFFGDNPFIKEDPDGRMPEEVLDLTTLDDNGQSATRVKQEDDNDSKFAPQPASVSPKPGQARIKSEPDANGGLDRRIKAEDDQDDRSLQEESPGRLHNGSQKGEPILISDDEDEPEADWELQENRNGRIVFRNKSKVAVAKNGEPDSDVQNAEDLDFLMEDLHRFHFKKRPPADRVAEHARHPGTEEET